MTGYRQGMHELLAPILFVVNSDKIRIDSAESTNDPLAFIFDANFVEHDAFALFSRLMRSTKSWFDSSANTLPGGHNARVRNKASSVSAPQQNIPIVVLCNHIQNNIIQVLDPTLCSHLKHLNIEPQLYGLRWIRLLFGREFPFEELLCLWDGLFAHDSSLSLVQWICAAMLLLIREEIIQADYITVLQKLMRYPSLSTLKVKTVTGLLDKAKNLQREYEERVTISSQEQHSRESSAASEMSNQKKSSRTGSSKSVAEISNFLVHGEDSKKTAAQSDNADNLAVLQQRKISELKARDRTLAKKVDRCISQLADILSDAQTLNERRNEIEGIVDELKVVQTELVFSSGTSMSMTDGNESESPVMVSRPKMSAKAAASNLHEYSNDTILQRNANGSSILATGASGLDSWISTLSTAAQDVDLSKTVKAASSLFSGLFEERIGTSTFAPFVPADQQQRRHSAAVKAISGIEANTSAAGVAATSSPIKSTPSTLADVSTTIKSNVRSRPESVSSSIKSTASSAPTSFSSASTTIRSARYPPDHWRNNLPLQPQIQTQPQPASSDDSSTVGSVVSNPNKEVFVVVADGGFKDPLS
ncbi:hypothetical protein HK100_006339 [Physocladia obscura]|uniref:Rab-GAP TBC domain-containing protein n=1 Tax=Physocladia obscura TaxID=109957 RepID=A0AAD5SQL8_9FUNG|nr:hypothetical protein HK100_006339 [Physocladia obscura]